MDGEQELTRYVFRTTARSFNRDADQNILLGRAVSTSGRGYKVMLGAVLAGSVIIGLLALWFFITGFVTMGVMCTMGVVLLVYMLYRERTDGEVKAGVRQAKKAHANMATADLAREVVVAFRVDGCRWTWGAGRKEENWYEYFELTRLFETEDLFFLSCNREPGFCVRKTDLEGGDVDGFRAWIEQMCGKRFQYYEINQEKWQNMLK